MTKAAELRQRSEAFAVAVVRFCETLPPSIVGRSVGQQLLKAATSAAANYRAACRAYTRPLFVSKLAIAAEEADESEFWLRLVVKTGLSSTNATADIAREAGELAAIFTAGVRSARADKARQLEKSANQA